MREKKPVVCFSFEEEGANNLWDRTSIRRVYTRLLSSHTGKKGGISIRLCLDKKGKGKRFLTASLSWGVSKQHVQLKKKITECLGI